MNETKAADSLSRLYLPLLVLRVVFLALVAIVTASLMLLSQAPDPGLRARWEGQPASVCGSEPVVAAPARWYDDFPAERTDDAGARQAAPFSRPRLIGR